METIMNKWIDSVLENPLPEEVIAIAFNLYEKWGKSVVCRNSWNRQL